MLTWEQDDVAFYPYFRLALYWEAGVVDLLPEGYVASIPLAGYDSFGAVYLEGPKLHVPEHVVLAALGLVAPDNVKEPEAFGVLGEKNDAVRELQVAHVLGIALRAVALGQPCFEFFEFHHGMFPFLTLGARAKVTLIRIS